MLLGMSLLSLIGWLLAIFGIFLAFLRKGIKRAADAPSPVWSGLKLSVIGLVLAMSAGKLNEAPVNGWVAMLLASGGIVVDLMFSMQGLSKPHMMRKDYNRLQNSHTLWVVAVCAIILLGVSSANSSLEGIQYVWMGVPIAGGFISVFAFRTLCSKKIEQTPSDARVKLNRTMEKDQTKLDKARHKAQTRMSKAAIAGMGSGAAIGAAASGAVQGMKIGSDVAASETLLMRTEAVSNINDRLANANVTAEQAAYIQQKTNQAHDLGARVSDSLATNTQGLMDDMVEASFELVRQKLTNMGMDISQKSDEEVAQTAISLASPTQLENLPAGLSDKQKAIALLGTK